MQLSTTFRHMDGSQAVREYTADKLEKIKKYFHKEPISAHATFSVERGFNHCVDLSITLPNGIAINAKETTEDMYSSIDLAAARRARFASWSSRPRRSSPAPRWPKLPPRRRRHPPRAAGGSLKMNA